MENARGVVGPDLVIAHDVRWLLLQPELLEVDEDRINQPHEVYHTPVERDELHREIVRVFL